ncbi:hypothetical protein PPTG_04247 [Phytophthora nicotianae INRA-310]|uniref:Uncharacterized protein n=1 Tax=Phytophthora nicotianae (strain INRA-310) TaxID=761204 RepID=W2R2M0_PHYN3|nr:hypothetical protein PPTG_04247 [Phytophthora nicotianae INRA-310]ETN18750.1 hypothetical protein PPTG_04247 [Phytophthora nicotianae INRA-310]
MEPMRRPGEVPTGYENWTINETALLAESIVETIVFGVTLQWNIKSVRDFVKAANACKTDEKLPVWLSQPRGQITEQVFKSDVMACLAEVAGGQARENDLAPNTLQQNFNISKRLGHLEDDSFVQSCMAKLDAGSCLAAVFVRQEPAFGIEHVRTSPPLPPNRRVFY